MKTSGSVIARGVELERARADGDVGPPGGVIFHGGESNGYVEAPACIRCERDRANRGVAGAADVAGQCRSAKRCVPVAGCLLQGRVAHRRVLGARLITMKRVITNGRAINAGGQTKKCVLTLGSVFIRITSVRGRADGVRGRRKRK